LTQRAGEGHDGAAVSSCNEWRRRYAATALSVSFSFGCSGRLFMARPPPLPRSCRCLGSLFLFAGIRFLPNLSVTIDANPAILAISLLIVPAIMEEATKGKRTMVTSTMGDQTEAAALADQGRKAGSQGGCSCCSPTREEAVASHWCKRKMMQRR
jgi:hypothetical protein